MKEERFLEKESLVDCGNSTQANKPMATPTDADTFRYEEEEDGTTKIPRDHCNTVID